MADYVNVTLSGNGDTLLLSAVDEGTYQHMTGSTGLGMLPTVTRFREGAGDGATFMGSRRAARALLLKIRVVASTERDMERALQRLAVLLRATDLTLTVVDPDQTAWQLQVAYESGMEGDYGADALTREPGHNVGGDSWVADFGLALTAGDPFWRRVELSALAFEQRGSVSAFLSPLARLRLSVSQAISDTVVTNDGTVASAVSWRIVGPSSGDTVVAIGGRGFRVTRPLADSDVVVVDPSKRGVPVVTLNGVRDYSVLAPAPKFPMLPPGDSTVSMSMAGAVPPTWVTTDQVEAVNEAKNPKLKKSLAGLAQSGQFSWAAGASAGVGAFSSGTDVTVAAWYEYTSWAEPWVSFAFPDASGDGLHVFIEFWAGSTLLETRISADVAMGGEPIPTEATKIRVGVGFHGKAGSFSRQAITFTQSPTPWFDGDTAGASWEGTPDASRSLKHVREKRGGSRIEASWHAGKEVVF